MITCVRNLSRSFLACSGLLQNHPHASPVADANETDRVVRILIAILYTTKNHLRAEWGAETSVPYQPLFSLSRRNSLDDGRALTAYEPSHPEYSDLLPSDFRGLQDDSGVGLPLQLTYFVEAYIKKYTDVGAFQAPQASQLQAQLSNLVAASGSMEMIRLTSVPVAILIHQKQVLALFGCVLPFALVGEVGWWAVPIVCLVCFALYGIDGIARQLEDPFGFDRNDIKVDGLVEDVRHEISGLLAEWRRVVGWSGTTAAAGREREVGNGGGMTGTANGEGRCNDDDDGLEDMEHPRKVRAREMFIAASTS